MWYQPGMRRAVLAAAAIALASPAAAWGATASARERHFTFVAGSGEENRVLVLRTADVFRVVDAGATILAGPGCRSVSPSEVECSAHGIDTVSVTLKDGNDRVSVGTATLAWISGGDGDDVLESGEGDDVLDGGAGVDVLKGGAGQDRLIGGPGSDVLSGGRLATEEVTRRVRARDFGVGICRVRIARDVAVDAVLYSGRAPLDVSLDGIANDGAAGEADNVLADVEAVWGGNGNDRLVGNGRANFLQGGAGNDTLVGRGGSDVLEGEVEMHGSQTGTGSNRLYGGDGNDCLLGGAGNESMRGGDGADRLSDEGGRDTLFAGDGRDYILARDLRRDDVNGGPNVDRATVDPRDRVVAVERFVRPPSPPSGTILRRSS